MEPREFGAFVKDLLIHCGFKDVCVIPFSADGGVDVNARGGRRIWMFENTVIQVAGEALAAFGRTQRGRRVAWKLAAIRKRWSSYEPVISEGELSMRPRTRGIIIALVDGFRLSKSCAR